MRLCCGILVNALATLMTVNATGQTPASPEAQKVTIGAGVPLHVVVDRRVSYTNKGRTVSGRLSQPIYGFDRVVVPVGTIVLGEIAEVHGVGKFRQFNSYLGGDFTRLREAQVKFTSLVLADGTTIPIESQGALRDSRVVHMASARNGGRWSQLKATVRTTISDEKRKLKDAVQKPDRMQRLKYAFLARLPYHPQVYDPGTQFVADLAAPVEMKAPAGAPSIAMEQLGERPPANTILHARLESELTSATAKRDDNVVAVLSDPVFSADHHLLLPEGTRLLGVVLRAQPAKRFGRNGELRFTFREVELPSGAKSMMKGDLAGADAGKSANVEIDEEGGAHATEPKAKYLMPLATVLLLQSAGEGDHDNGQASGGGDPINGGAAAGGFGLMGRLLALSSGSRTVAYGIGYYGASRAIYSRFIARGRDVVFPRDTRLEIKVGER